MHLLKIGFRNHAAHGNFNAVLYTIMCVRQQIFLFIAKD